MISDRMGSVPDDVPKSSSSRGRGEVVETLAITLTIEVKEFQLDLRKPMDLERSIFFPPPELARYKDGPSVTG